MSLETIYYIGQTIAVIGILASLIFVGIQIRQNTEQSKAAAVEAAHRSFIDWYYSQSSETAAVFVKAQDGLEKLGAEERYQFFAVTMPFLMNLQEAHLKWSEGSLVEARWRFWDKFASMIAISPPVVTAWEERGFMFSDSFNAFFGEKVRNGKSMPERAASWVAPPPEPEELKQVISSSVEKPKT